MAVDLRIDLNTDQIRSWQSIVTLIIFVVTNIVVLFPFDCPVYIHRSIWNFLWDILSALRIILPREPSPKVTYTEVSEKSEVNSSNAKRSAWRQFWVRASWVKVKFPVDSVTGPLVADLLLLAMRAIGRNEVYDGTIGANHISPIDIMAFFLTLAYIAISIDASGLIRFLAFKVLQWGGDVGHLLFLYLYIFFFGLGTFIGNDPIILSGTAFLAYMTRVSNNIDHPRAWIHTQFAVANIASAILVSSNPTNLVLAGAFQIKFVTYTANMIVPVVITAIVLFPFLLYFVFRDERLIPVQISMHELPEDLRNKKAINPNIPNARGIEDVDADDEDDSVTENIERKNMNLAEIINPYVDKWGAAVGSTVMAVTLTTLLALNAASTEIGGHPVYWVTLPAAFAMLCWDLSTGWRNRKETRELAREGRLEIQRKREEQERHLTMSGAVPTIVTSADLQPSIRGSITGSSPEDQKMEMKLGRVESFTSALAPNGARPQDDGVSVDPLVAPNGKDGMAVRSTGNGNREKAPEIDVEDQGSSSTMSGQSNEPETLLSLCRKGYSWCQETFPTVTTVFAHLPFALIPFAFSMFVLVQALVTKGWVPVFAYGWDHWVDKTGTMGAIGGMGLLSVLLCNFAGTNIGTTILLSRVIQAWEEIHHRNGIPISDRVFWATVYSMALGVNYGAFSTAFSASLAGLLWKDILARKHIHVKRLEFARVNIPIIAIAMTVGCAVLVGEVYIIRNDEPYSLETD